MQVCAVPLSIGQQYSFPTNPQVKDSRASLICVCDYGALTHSTEAIKQQKISFICM